jgi:uncharacterized protein YjiS (DUF1127 family)
LGWKRHVQNSLRAYAKRCAAYQQTVRELSACTDRELADMGISRFDVRRIAREAAALAGWGRGATPNVSAADAIAWKEVDMAAIATVAKFLSPSRGMGGWLGRPVQDALLAAQIGRMIKALCDLSDEQLKEIGITRRDIPAYAEKLVLGEERTATRWAAGRTVGASGCSGRMMRRRNSCDSFIAQTALEGNFITQTSCVFAGAAL